MENIAHHMQIHVDDVVAHLNYFFENSFNVFSSQIVTFYHFYFFLMLFDFLRNALIVDL